MSVMPVSLRTAYVAVDAVLASPYPTIITISGVLSPPACRNFVIMRSLASGVGISFAHHYSLSTFLQTE